MNLLLGITMTNDYNLLFFWNCQQGLLNDDVVFCLSLLQNGQLQQRLDNVQRDFIIFNREK